VVFRYGGRRYYNYGHVGIVLGIDKKNNKILIEEMNYVGRFIADKRWVNINDPKII
jgi:surface antigen